MENKTPATKQSFDEPSSDLLSPPKKPRESDQTKTKATSSIGKRFHKAQNKISGNVSNRLMEESMSATPFSQDPMNSVNMETKPFRSVIKRYWTEEEVSLT